MRSTAVSAVTQKYENRTAPSFYVSLPEAITAYILIIFSVSTCFISTFHLFPASGSVVSTQDKIKTNLSTEYRTLRRPLCPSSHSTSLSASKRVRRYAIFTPDDCTFTRKESARIWSVFRSRNSLFWDQTSSRYEILLAGRKLRSYVSTQIPSTKWDPERD